MSSCSRRGRSRRSSRSLSVGEAVAADARAVVVVVSSGGWGDIEAIWDATGE